MPASLLDLNVQVVQLTLDMVSEALDAAWGDTDRCTLADVEAQLAADGIPFTSHVLTSMLFELETTCDIRRSSDAVIWRIEG